MQVYLPQEYTIGKEVIRQLADVLEANGVSRADAVEMAFDHYVGKYEMIERTGEVLLPDQDDEDQYASAMCVNIDMPVIL